MARDKYTTISIPASLHREVKEFIDKTNFTSVGEFVKHLIRDTLSGGSLSGKESLTASEVEAIRKRLKKMGYI